MDHVIPKKKRTNRVEIPLVLLRRGTTKEPEDNALRALFTPAELENSAPGSAILPRKTAV